ncbi:MAG: tRNA (N(6)-L-threonylcarbamoyladenosine(37)-C(2))-methylthiotransferase MtaB [Lachnospiraceae bacterium]|nr:tRNA (N(6)-L-threonylcarbamoyladenosine(37)-C(2))-methylthiotransferase MtaB [Lachnospiraceae bacterium]
MNNIKVALHNLGCKVNQYETDAMSQLLSEVGYTIVPFEEGADVYIINTCTVTNMADRKSRQMLHKAKKMNPKALVIAVGCYVQAAGEELKKDNAIDIIVGNNKKGEIVNILNEYFGNDIKTDVLIDINAPCDYEDLTLFSKSREHTRVFLKIQDGCNQFCTYCIIPYARGRIRSKSIDVVRKETVKIASEGVKEIVLTGIHLSSYGKNYKENKVEQEDYNLVTAIKDVAAIDGIERVRLGSLEPGIIDEEFLNEVKKIDKFCPHFHLSLQSGCDSVLKRMNRKYGADEYLEKCRLIREVFPDAAITTDIIVGFPGETDEEFETTLEFAKKVNFAQIHVFKYSPRKGTVAARMEGQISEPVKSLRSDRLIETGEKLRKDFVESFVESSQDVLFEEVEEINGKTYICGYTKEYVRVAVPCEKNNEKLYENRIAAVKITKVLNNENLLAEIIKMY